MSNTGFPRQLPYTQVDVFAEHALEGNMLAIFTNAHGLSTEQMQALARETNLSETTFILPSEDHAKEAVAGVRVRIFTVEEELPFAGHPTLGTASWLYRHHPTLAGSPSITLDLNSGPVTVRFLPPAPGEAGVFGTMRQHDPHFGTVHDRATIAHVTGIPLEDFDPSLPIETVSTGLPFCVVPLKSQAAVARLSVPQALARAYLKASDAKFFYVIAPTDPGSHAHYHARMQFGGGEDPATGSAAGCAIAYLVRHGVIDSERQTILEQGVEVLRPSRLVVQARLTDRDVSHVFVGGRTITVASGHFSLS